MKLLKALPYFFLAIGLILFTLALLLAWNTRQFRRAAAVAEGVVIENVWTSTTDSWVYCPKIRFQTAAGRTVAFVSTTGSQPAAFQVGQSVRVLYDPERPDRAGIDTFWEQWLASVVLGILGVVFSLPGAVWIYLRRRARQLTEWLKINGQRIQAELTGVELNRSVRVNGSCPWRVTAQWLNPATGRIHVFRGANLWYNPSRYVTGKSIEVMIDPNRPHRYYMDTSFLPELED
jgi:hypothetical protein